MEITVSIKNVYGEERVYPECETSKKLASLAGTRTLTDRAIALIQSLGYRIVVAQKTL